MSGKYQTQTIWVIYSEGDWSFQEVKVPLQEIQTYFAASDHMQKEQEEEVQQQAPRLGPQGLRKLFLKLVSARFPVLESLGEKVVNAVDDTTTLNQLIVRISSTQTIEEAQQYLLEMGKNGGE